MTIATTTNRAQWQGNGATTVFSFSFEIDSVSEIVLVLTSPSGTITPISPSAYSVTGLGLPAGGSITYPLSGAPVAQGFTLTLTRIVSLQQLVDLVNQSNYYPDVVEGALDYLMQCIQQLALQLSYAIQAPTSDPPLNLTLPSAAARAGEIIGFDASGNVTLLTPPASIGAGNMTAELGSNGRPGFKAGTDFVAGTTTTLNLSKAYGSVANVFVAFDGTYQEKDSYQIIGAQITFGSYIGNVFTPAPIPSSVNNVDIIGGTTLSSFVPSNGSVGPAQLAPGAITDIVVAVGAAIQATKLSYTQGGTGAQQRTIANRLQDQVSVKDFGAKGDGSTDDTGAIQAADTWAIAQNPPAQIIFPPGVYMATQLVVNVNSNWIGAGRNSTTIRQIIGSNKDLIYGANSSSNWGSSTPAGFPYNFTIIGFTFDGNWNSGAGNTAGSAYAVWGDRCTVRDLFIKNSANYGMRTEYLDSTVDYGQDWFESTFDDIRIDTTGQDGWLNNGPHDQQTVNVTILDAGQSAANTYSGFNFGSRFSGRLVSCHASSRSASLRMKYSWYCGPGSVGEATGGCNIEGSYTACLGLFSSQWIFDPSTRYYASFNGPNIYLGGTCNSNQIAGYMQGGAGAVVPVGLQFSTTSGDQVAGNFINLSVGGCSYAATFTAQDSGGNDIVLNGYTSTGDGIAGVPNTSTRLRLNYQGGGATRYIDTFNQNAQQSIGPNSSATITWPYAFPGAPIVQVTPAGPTAVMSNPLWITNNTATAVTIFNQGSLTVTAYVKAEYGV